MGKRPCCDKANVNRGHWTLQEDLCLKAFIQRYGTHGEWMSLPRRAGLRRCGKSCRLRWLNYLRPGIKRGHFSQEEENVIWRLYSIFGSKWSVIASHLPGRTDNDIKNYWNTRLKFKWSQWEKNRVSATAEVMSATLNANEDGEYSEVIVKGVFHGSMHDETGTMPSSDISVENKSPLAFGPNEDLFETAALLRTICNTNMKTNGTAPQDHPEFSYSAVDMPTLVPSSGCCGFLSFDDSYGPSVLDSQVSAVTNSSDCRSVVDISKPLPLFQGGGDERVQQNEYQVFCYCPFS